MELQVDWAFHGNVLPLQGCPSSSGVSLKLYNLTAWVWEWARIMHFSSCTMLWKNKTNWVIFNLICQAAVLNHPVHDDCKHCFRSIFLLFSWIKPRNYSHPNFACWHSHNLWAVIYDTLKTTRMRVKSSAQHVCSALTAQTHLEINKWKSRASTLNFFLHGPA